MVLEPGLDLLPQPHHGIALEYAHSLVHDPAPDRHRQFVQETHLDPAAREGPTECGEQPALELGAFPRPDARHQHRREIHLDGRPAYSQIVR